MVLMRHTWTHEFLPRGETTWHVQVSTPPKASEIKVTVTRSCHMESSVLQILCSGKNFWQVGEGQQPRVRGGFRVSMIDYNRSERVVTRWVTRTGCRSISVSCSGSSF